MFYMCYLYFRNLSLLLKGGSWLGDRKRITFSGIYYAETNTDIEVQFFPYYYMYFLLLGIYKSYVDWII